MPHSNLDGEFGFAMARAREDQALDDAAASLTRDDMQTFGILGFIAGGWTAGWYAFHQVAVFWMAGGF